jgi:DNA replicative helicase MCM subunit Mcm2 (Cdc46/Mcm family)
MSESDQQLETRIDELEARLDEVEALLEPEEPPTSLDSTMPFTVEPVGESRSIRADVKNHIDECRPSGGESAPTQLVIEGLIADGYDESDVKHTLETMRREGEIYEPIDDHLRVV